MPRRRVKPRWGYAPPGFQTVELFTREEAADLARVLGREAPKDAERLYERLNDEGEFLHAAVYLVDSAVTHAEIKAAFDAIAPVAKHLLWCLENVDSKSRGLIAAQYQYHVLATDNPRDNNTQRFNEDTARVRRLYSVLRFCQENFRVPRGGPSIGMISFYARKFAELYQEFTGQRFEAPRSKKRTHDPMRAFMEQTIRKLAPKATDANVTTAMRYAAMQLGKDGDSSGT